MNGRALIALALMAALVWPAVAVLGHGGNAGLVHACVSIGTGLTRIVGPSEACLATETARDWGIVGPQGIPGPTGPTGPAGPPGPRGPLFRHGEGGYAWADQPTSPSYTPSPTYSWNSSGGAITIVRGSVGTYAVTFAGLTIIGGNVQVTAYGFGAERCKVANWSAGTVNVRCYAVDNSLVDTLFTVLYVK